MNLIIIAVKYFYLCRGEEVGVKSEVSDAKLFERVKLLLRAVADIDEPRLKVRKLSKLSEYSWLL